MCIRDRAGTCGLHVHVSRLAFGETEEQQDTAIARVLYFFEKHWEELLKFSRRVPQERGPLATSDTKWFLDKHGRRFIT